MVYELRFMISCRTNPISPVASGSRRAKCAKRTQSGRSARPCRQKCAKQSQTWAGWDIWAAAHQEGQWRETKPTTRLRISDCGLRIVQNEPNSGRCARGEPPSFHYSTPMPIVQNEPNLHPPRGIGGASRDPKRGSLRLGARSTLHVGVMTPNKPNSAWPAGRPGPWEGETCKTNPISAAGTGPTARGAAPRADTPHPSTIPSGIPVPDPGGKHEKQSQFPVDEIPIPTRQADPMDLESAAACQPYLRS